MGDPANSEESLTRLPGWRVDRSAPAMRDECCLLIATYRRPAECMRLLAALIELDDIPGEVVFIDGARDDDFSRDLWEWAGQRRLPFDLIYAQSPAGTTRQRNVGLDLSTRRYVIFLDDDAIPLHGFFREVQGVFESDDAVGVVAGCMANEMDREIDRRWTLRFQLGITPRLEPMQFHSSGIHAPKSMMKPFTGTREVDVVFGCAMAFRREVFEEMRFSEFFGGYAQGEDTEVALRAGRRWKVVCRGEALIEHHPSPGGRPPGYVKGKMDMVNRFFIWKRHVADPGWSDRARFWIDNAFQVAMDLAWFCRRPWQTASIAHCGGLLVGWARCLVSPPAYEEPPVRRRYVLDASMDPAVVEARA